MERNIRIEKLVYDKPTLHLRIAEFEWAAIQSAEWLSTVPKSWHYHKETEIVIILQGHVDFFIDDEIVTLSSGDAVLIGSGQIHASKRNLRDRRSQIVCHFDLQHHLDGFAAPYFPHFFGMHSPLSRFNRILRTNKQLNDEIFRSVLNIHHELARQEPGFDLAASLLLKQILLLLVRNDPLGAGLMNRSAGMLELRPVIEHVNRHLGDKISVRQMSLMCNMSYHYFSRFFKKTMGVTFLDFVNGLRVKEAERLLATTTNSVARIAEDVGIPNLAHFYEMFRKFNHLSPVEYRKHKFSLTGRESMS